MQSSPVSMVRAPWGLRPISMTALKLAQSGSILALPAACLVISTALPRLALTPDVGVLESAIPLWVRERERRRFHVARMTVEDDDPCSELFVEANALILRAPCSSFRSVSAKLKALTDRQIGMQHGLDEHDLPCLEQIIAFLDQELRGGAVGLSSRLAPDLIEALRLGEQAATMDLSEPPDEVWLGDPLYDRAGDLMDGIHLAPCTSRADAAIKLGALQADLDEVENWDTVRATVSASVGSLRSWLLDAPSKIATDDIITRREFRQLLADAGASMADEARQRGPSLTEAALEVGMHHLQLAAAEHRAHRPDLGAADMAAPALGSAPISAPTRGPRSQAEGEGGLQAGSATVSLPQVGRGGQPLASSP